MNLKTYLSACSEQEKNELAEKFDTSVAYLNQLATGYRKAGVKFLMGIESATDGKVTPAELRSDYAA